jgi:hypothetical protein
MCMYLCMYVCMYVCLYVLTEFQKKFDVITTKGEAYPQAVLNDIIHNASLSSSEGTVTENLW